MHALVTCAVGLLASVSGAAHEDGDAFSLLQMSSAKVSVHSDKECKAATKARKDAKKTAKTDRAAAKAARAAWKAAHKTMQESKEAEAAADSKVEELCPLPEVDRSPDEGCSTTLITSVTSCPIGDRFCPMLLERGLPGGKWYGFEEVLPGGGVPSVLTPNGDGGSVMLPLTTPAMRKLGIAVMQPCSVAWTVGSFKYPYVGVIQNQNGKLTSAWGDLAGQELWKESTQKSPSECRAWAGTVMPWPAGAMVEFLTHSQGGTCKVFKMLAIPWKKDGFSLTLVNSANKHLSCYLGNPEEWKERLDKEKAEGQTIDKCSKTSLWSSGGFELQQNRTTRSVVPKIGVGRLSFPDPSDSTPEGRKMCLKWVKANPKCANAIAIELNGGGCHCITTTNSIQKQVTRQEAPSIASQICML